MIKGGDLIELTIEKLTFQGAGLGRYDGMAVFVDGACPEDKLKVYLEKVNKNYAKGRIVEILEPSRFRTKPICALSRPCGGCVWQFIDYDFACSQKQLIVKEALNVDVEIQPVIKSPDIAEFRHKIQYPIRETKNSKRILAGYFRENTHEIVNIKHCPIQPRIIDEIIKFIRENWEFGAYSEKTKKGLLKNVLFRKSSSNEGILATFVLNSDDLRKVKIEPFIDKLIKTFPQVTGVLVNFNPTNTNKILGDEFKLIKGEDFIYESMGDKRYKISADSFFQTNPKCAIKLFDVVKSLVEKDSTVLDAYGGVGAIGIWVSDKASKITLVEENKNAIVNAKENFKLNNCKNYEVYEGDAKVCFNNFYIKKTNFDTVILDPPRKGCDKKALELISKITSSIIYVSCNPQTLSRDIKILKELGFSLKFVQPVDMFPYTYHIETVAYLKKEL